MTDFSDLRRRAALQSKSGNYWAGKCLMLLDRLDEAISLLGEHVDDEPCWFDHHGYCQAHGWLTDEDRCPHARGREFLALFVFDREDHQ